MSTSTESKNVIYMNRPQIITGAVDANESVSIDGRGTGKTVGKLAPRVHRCATLMPRSSGVNISESYMQQLDRTLPPMIGRWQEMGLKRDIDFFVRRFPPKNIGLRLPYVSPETAEHTIFIRVNRYDVSAMRMVSQDRPGSSNGMSIDWGIGDEVKLINKEKLDTEVMPTFRGNNRYFGDCHLHHSIMFTTDMPTSSGAKWIHEYEERMDKEQIELILAVKNEVNSIKRRALVRGKFTQAETSQIAFYEKELSKIRKTAVHYSESSTLENIDVLGVEFIRKMKRNLPEFVFRTAILNERPGKVENTFYPDLMDKHFYNAIDYSFVDGLPEDKYGKGKLMDCRKDLDLDRSQPIEIALDVGGRINTLAAGQEESRMLKILNALHVVEPGRNRMRHLAAEFDNYYKYYYKKEIIIYYDHTHVASNSVSDKNPIDEFCDELEKLGWTVVRYYVGVTPSYRNRFHLWGLLLRARPIQDNEFYSVAFNKDNTSVMRTAMECTRVALGGKTGFEKDKRMERDEKADQSEAPHYTDAVDILVYGMIKRRQQGLTASSSLISF